MRGLEGKTPGRRLGDEAGTGEEATLALQTRTGGRAVKESRSHLLSWAYVES